MTSSLALSLFLTTERCDVVVSPDQELVLRRSDNPGDVFLLDPSIPRDPDGIAKIRVAEGKLYLVPGSTAKPILVNGVKVNAPAVLHPGDRIRVGYTVLVVQSISETTDASASEVRTMTLSTAYWRQRAPLASEAYRLAQWSEGFDRMMSAKDEEEVSRIILQQLLRLVQGNRGLLSLAQSSRKPSTVGLNSSEEERVLRWFREGVSTTGVLTPSVEQVLDKKALGLALAGRLDSEPECWLFYLEPSLDLASHETFEQAANQAMSVLSSMLGLYHTLHQQQKYQRHVEELSKTTRVFIERAEQPNIGVIRSKFVFRSQSLETICGILAKAAAAPSPVLLLGEPGTGKQLAAEALHAARDRADREMISVNLVEIPDSLVESQLFGHEEGVFTNARDTTGLVARADRSTLFLDEIGEASLAVQAKLLRVLEYGDFQKIGAPRRTKVDIRLVTATNRDLLRAVRDGRFRQDLFDRINVIPVKLPALRERPEDIPLLIDRFLDEFNLRIGKRVELTSEARQHLQWHTWPDNVRGLRNYIERTVALADRGPRLFGPKDLPPLGPVEAEAADRVPIAHIVQQLRDNDRHNQARILSALGESPDRQHKGVWAKRIGMCRPVFCRELQKLIAYSLNQGVPMAFFETRVALREEDRKKIDALASSR